MDIDALCLRTWVFSHIEVGINEFIEQGRLACIAFANDDEFAFVDGFDALFFYLFPVVENGGVALFDDFTRGITEGTV